MNRFLTFHIHETSGNEVRMAPSGYYMDAEYSKVAVRIYAEDAPLRDAKFNIYNDGESIFRNRTPTTRSSTTGGDITGDANYDAVLAAGQNIEELAEDFNDTVIARDTWIYCNMVDSGGAKNITVQLELYPVSEGESGDE